MGPGREQSYTSASLKRQVRRATLTLTHGPPPGPAPASPRSQSAMPALVTKEAPDFTADAVVNGEFKTVRLSDYRGKYVVLFFYPLDFTFVCPTELIAFSDKIE